MIWMLPIQGEEIYRRSAIPIVQHFLLDKFEKLCKMQSKGLIWT